MTLKCCRLKIKDIIIIIIIIIIMSRSFARRRAPNSNLINATDCQGTYKFLITLVLAFVLGLNLKLGIYFFLFGVERGHFTTVSCLYFSLNGSLCWNWVEVWWDTSWRLLKSECIQLHTTRNATQRCTQRIATVRSIWQTSQYFTKSDISEFVSLMYLVISV